MATKLSPIKKDMYEEDVAFQNSVSQQLLSKFAQNIQHINEKQLMHWSFRYLGLAAPVSTGEDGVLTVPFDFEIAAISYSFRTIGGTSADFTFIDIHEIDTSGVDQGSIFLTKPNYNGNATAGHRGYFVNYLENTNSGVISGIVYPNFSTDADRLFDAGTTLRVDLDVNDTDSTDICFNIFYRPQ